MTKITTSWMWQDETSLSVMGATVDVDRSIIHWFDEPGCACKDSDAEQTISDFLARGARYLTLPEEVEAEMRADLLMLQATLKAGEAL